MRETYERIRLSAMTLTRRPPIISAHATRRRFRAGQNAISQKRDTAKLPISSGMSLREIPCTYPKSPRTPPDTGFRSLRPSLANSPAFLNRPVPALHAFLHLNSASLMRKRRVVILGATGSIGASARKVARDIPDRMEIVGMSAHGNETALREAGREFPNARLAISGGTGGEDRLVELATMPEADMVLIAIVGTAGLRPALAAIEAGKDLAVASKEILVMAGEAVMNSARENGVQVLPVDSEHNAIYQCLEGHASEHVRRLILTASGGPFRTWPSEKLADVTLEQALKHPTWEMGRKIAIDSATLFNKGLEMIEARWLFDVEMPRVDVIVHPQSIIHSMVEFVDGSVLAQLSTTDMCFPIQYAVTWPDRVPNTLKPLDFAQLGQLTF